MSDFDFKESYKIFDIDSDIVVFDVGSYDGTEAIDFRKHYPNSKIYAFDADTDNYKKTFNRCKNYNIVVESYAISDVYDVVKFYPTKGKYTGSGSILRSTALLNKRFPDMKISDPVKVFSISLYEYCNKNNIEKIDILHIDVQGAEALVLKGLKDIRPKIIFSETVAFGEYESGLKFDCDEEPIHEANHYKSFDALLFSMGYSVIKRTRNDTMYILNS
jgi:FkbM family methyltransferase